MLNFRNKKYFILDLDGTLYLGNRVFPYTLKFIETLRKTGRRPIFLTNNSSKSTKEYFQKLRRLGMARNMDEIYTSGRATIEYLQKRGVVRIFLLATPAVEKEFEEAGFQIQNGLHKPKKQRKSLRAQTKLQEVRANVKNMPQAVVLSFDMTFTYEKFCRAYDLIVAGVPFYATHPDNLLPLENGAFHPDVGALIAAFHTATGRLPHIIGKPKKHIYEQLRARLRCKKEEMVMIGDRLYTDIKGANEYGIDTILVLSGETTRKMLTRRAPKPAMIAANVGALIPRLHPD